MNNRVRQYTKEFKLQSIRLSEELGSVVEAAKQLGIPDVNIYAWRKQFAAEGVTAVKSTQIKSDELLIENQRLLKENTQLKKVNHILKAAAAFLSQDHLK